MKHTLLTIFLFASIGAMGQTPKEICKERGHVPCGYSMSTLLYCPPYQIDEKDYTIMVYPDCNTHTTTCTRCGESFTLPSQETRDTIWKRDKLHPWIQKIEYLVKPDSIPQDTLFPIDTLNIGVFRFADLFAMRDSINLRQIPEDTIACEMMVSDGTYSGNFELKRTGPDKGVIYVVSGYDVVDTDGNHIFYLDSDKKKMKYRVWLSQREDK